jgi:hypothetical protein
VVKSKRLTTGNFHENGGIQMATKSTELSEHLIVPVSVDQLLLNKENPRLASGRDVTTQDDIVKLLWTEMAVDEVALSIAANGFFPEENLFAVPQNPKEKDEKKKKYIVVEGNRRLAAVRLLREDALRQKVKATDLPRISVTEKKALDELPVSIYESRKALWEYFAFRHINGPKPWDSFSKAKYIAYVKQHYRVSLDTIADRTGDRHSTVKKLYRGYVILLQAESRVRFIREARIRNRFYFLHLYIAASHPEVLRFLGTDSRKSLAPNPVPRSHLSQLEEFVIWLFGSKDRGIEPVVFSVEPDLTMLQEVLGSEPALACLRANRHLKQAYRLAIGEQAVFKN